MKWYGFLSIFLFSLPVVFANTTNDNCQILHLLGYAWEECGTIWTWSMLGIPLLAIIVAPIGIFLTVIIWRIRK